MSTSAPLNLYDLTIPTFTRTLTNLHAILQKGASSAASSELVSSRIHENMFALPKQIQNACDAAKFFPVRVADHPNVVMEDNETTLDDLLARIQKTLTFLGEVKREEFEGKESKEILLMNTYKFDAVGYATVFALPNFFFHVVTAYDILRMKGVEIGKWDYIGQVPKVEQASKTASS